MASHAASPLPSGTSISNSTLPPLKGRVYRPPFAGPVRRMIPGDPSGGAVAGSASQKKRRCPVHPSATPFERELRNRTTSDPPGSGANGDAGATGSSVAGELPGFAPGVAVAPGNRLIPLPSAEAPFSGCCTATAVRTVPAATTSTKTTISATWSSRLERRRPRPTGSAEREGLDGSSDSTSYFTRPSSFARKVPKSMWLPSRVSCKEKDENVSNTGQASGIVP